MGDSEDAFMRNQNSAGGVQARPKAQARVNVLQLKLIGQSHPTGLTPNLLKLFEARPPLEYKPPPHKAKCPPYHGVAHLVTHFAQPTDPEYSPPLKEVETPAQKKARIHQLRLDKGAAKAAEELHKYDPTNDLNVTGDPYKTLFVARLNYETTESRLKREFETYGPIKRVKMIFDQKSNKPRGYAFVEFAHTRDMKAAYKQADGRKIDGRRVLVDVERGRTVPSWRPRRLGGGLGTTRAGGEDTTRVGEEDATRVGGEEANQRHSAREVQLGGPSRSQEPRVRDDREREKSRERGRDKEREREKSRERSHDRPRDREHREDRHHRDRERARDKDRERDHSGRGREHRERDRTRDRERGRDRGRDNERERDRDRDHYPREREKEYEVGDGDYTYRGRSHDREYAYDRMESKNDIDRHTERERGYDHGEDNQGWFDQSDHGHRHRETEPEGKQYEHYPSRREYDQRSEEGEGEDNYNHERAD